MNFVSIVTGNLTRAVFLLCLLWGGSALAGKLRVAVVPFEGKNADAVEKEVRGIIGKKHTVIGKGEWTKAAKATKATRLNAKNVKKVAKKLRADAVVQGSLDKKRGKLVLTVKVRDGSTGDFVGEEGAEATLAKPKLDAKAKKKISKTLLAQLGDIGSSGTSADDSDDSSSDATDEDNGSSDDDQTVGKKDPAPKDPDDNKPAPDEDSDADRDASADDDKPEPSRRRDEDEDVAADSSPTDDSSAPRSFIALGVGASTRSLSFNSEANLAAPPQPYNGKFAPIALLDGTVYPMALAGSKGFLANVGVSFLFQRVLFLSTAIGDVKLGTTQQRLGAGLHVRYPMGKLGLIGGVRYTLLKFEIDKGAAPAGTPVDVPNVSYSFLEPTVGVEFALSDSLTLGLTARYLAALDAGEIATADYYGVATVTALEAEGTVDYSLSKALFVRALVGFSTVGYSFNGSGALTTNRDADATQDVFGARDTYMTVGAQAGYRF